MSDETTMIATETTPEVTTEVETKVSKAKKTPKPKAKKDNKPENKGKGKDKKADKPKANTAPKSKPMPDGRSVHADEPVREPKWSDRRKNIVLAMRKLGATGVTSAVGADAIADAAAKLGSKELKGDKGILLTKIVLDVYRTNELVHNGFALTVKQEGTRALHYYLTQKGRNTKFPEAAKSASKEKE